MKKYVFVALCVFVVLMIASCSSTVESGETELSINPDTARVSNGEMVSVDVEISNVEGLSGFQFDVNYDSSVLEFQEAKEGTFLNNNGQESTYCIAYDSSSPGLVENLVCVKFGGSEVAGSGVLETLTFKAIGVQRSVWRLDARVWPNHFTNNCDGSKRG